MSVAPESTVAVILGASTWPRFPVLQSGQLSTTLANSAAQFREYLLSDKGLGLPPSNIQNLFDDARPPADILLELANFLVNSQKDAQICDLILYFVGHGTLEGDSYYLLTKYAKEDHIVATGLSLAALSETLHARASNLRKFLIFDACFSGSAGDHWPVVRRPPVKNRRLDDVPTRGIALLCSSDRELTSKGSGFDDLTLFTGNLLAALNSQYPNQSARISLRDVHGLICQRMARQPHGMVVRPQIHSPDQREGDIADFPFFPNGAKTNDGGRNATVNAPNQRVDFDRRRGLVALGGAMISLTGLFAYSDVFPYYPDYSSVAKLLNLHRWVTYDPRDFQPGREVNPSIESIKEDLRLIRQAGFTGIVTFSCYGSHSEIPRLWKDAGLQGGTTVAIIVGVWDPTSNDELARAARVGHYADAYCVGHNGLTRQYYPKDLKSAIHSLRRATSRPVTTSDEKQRYTDEIAALGDWVFPDIHNSLNYLRLFKASDVVRESVAMHLEFTTHMADLADRVSRPLMLKMVTFPHAVGIQNAGLALNDDAQREFFARLGEALMPPESGLRVAVNLAAHSAFDISWKRPPRFNSWDSQTGLLDQSGNPRPAVAEIVNR